MAPSINRTAIVLNLTAFFAFVVLCEMTQVPMIQEDILKRCQDAFMTHGIPIQGLSVEGRDVVLKGLPQSEIISSRTYSLAAGLNGVRDVRTKVVHQDSVTADEKVLAPVASTRQRELQDKIDRLLDNREIEFSPDSAELTPASEKVLDEVSRYLTEDRGFRCEIWVYASPDPGQGVTRAMLRALSTEDFLIGKGIAEWRLSAYALKFGGQEQGLSPKDLGSRQGEDQTAVPAAPAGSLNLAAQRRRADRMVDLVVKAS